MTTAETFEYLVQDYTQAVLLLLLEQVSPGVFSGVAGVTIYYAEQAIWAKNPDERDFPSRDRASILKTLVIGLSAADAQAFVGQLYAGLAKIPMTDYLCTFSLDHSEVGFASVSSRRPEMGESMLLLQNSHWLRRHRTIIKRIRDIDLTPASVVSFTSALPRCLPVRMRPLELESRLEAVGDFFEILEPPVCFSIGPSESGLRYVLSNRVGVATGAFRIVVRTYAGQMVLSSEVYDLHIGEGEIPVDGDCYLEYELLRDGIIVDSFSGRFIKFAGINFGLTEGAISIEVDASGEGLVEIDRAPSTRFMTWAGKPPPSKVGQLDSANRAANAWREELASSFAFTDEVFAEHNEARARRQGILYLAKLVGVNRTVAP